MHVDECMLMNACVFYFLVVCVNLSFTFWHFSRYPICSKSTNGECMLMGGGMHA